MKFSLSLSAFLGTTGAIATLPAHGVSSACKSTGCGEERAIDRFAGESSFYAISYSVNRQYIAIKDNTMNQTIIDAGMIDFHLDDMKCWVSKSGIKILFFTLKCNDLLLQIACTGEPPEAGLNFKADDERCINEGLQELRDAGLGVPDAMTAKKLIAWRDNSDFLVL